uniref:BPTI/Kunitz inhibitor domain-containing protein n=1 Tax=Parastrongyloides trichosuri TaxID=131310 RepID=A0A0N4Z525_PARTI
MLTKFDLPKRFIMKIFITLTLLFIFSCGVFSNDDCLLPKNVGIECAKPKGMKFYFDTRTKICQPFMYNGCDGNKNKFDTAAKCKAACSNTTVPTGKKTADKCSSGIFAATDLIGNQLSCSECPENSKCVDDKCCYDPDYVCNLDYDAGKFPAVGSHTPRFYFAKEYNSCMIFTYYGSQGNPNNFDNFNDCMRYCKEVRTETTD